jgi:hypothetical protein
MYLYVKCAFIDVIAMLKMCVLATDHGTVRTVYAPGIRQFHPRVLTKLVL